MLLLIEKLFASFVYTLLNWVQCPESSVRREPPYFQTRGFAGFHEKGVYPVVLKYGHRNGNK